MEKRIVNEMPKIRVVLRMDKINSDGKCPLNYYITLNGKTIKKTSGFSIRPKNWDSVRRKIKGGPKDLLRIEAGLSEKIAEFKRYFLSLDATGGVISRKTVDDFFNDFRFDDFYSYYEGILLKRIELKKSTREKYVLCLKILKEFCKKKKLFNIRFIDITLSFIEEFDKYLIYQLNLSSDSAYNYHKCLKYVFNQALKDDLIVKSPYFGFKAEKAERRKVVIPLSLEEIRVIEELEIPKTNKVLNNVQDAFLLMLNTGVRYSDLFSISLENKKTIPSSLKGERLAYIEIVQKKTEQNVLIPLNTKSRSILNKLRARNKLNIKTDCLVPKITNQALNRNLKIIGEMAGIDKKLTCHLARHSFACNLLNNKISLECVSRLLGHRSIKSTMIYAKTDTNIVLNSVNVLNFSKEI
ncbi:MAG: site-specific integrase [Flavobacteriales bacterium]|nr:site-specific integrase [Flavobacteriales bacterium]